MSLHHDVIQQPCHNIQYNRQTCLSGGYLSDFWLWLPRSVGFGVEIRRKATYQLLCVRCYAHKRAPRQALSDEPEGIKLEKAEKQPVSYGIQQ